MLFLPGARYRSEGGRRLSSGMRNLVWIAGGAICVLFVAFLVCVRTTPVEPRYQGQAVQQWMRGVSLKSYSGQYRIQPTETALRAIGTNALPSILSELQVRDHGPLVERCIRWFQRTAFGRPGSPFARLLADYWPPDLRHADAERALIMLAEPLGTNLLWKLMAHPNPRVGRAAARAAGTVYIKSFGASDSGPTDIFSAALLSSDKMVRAAAPYGLLSVGGLGSKDIERLLGLLFDPVPVVRRSASETLIVWASSNPPWPEIEQALRRAVDDPDPQTRSNVAIALKQRRAP